MSAIGTTKILNDMLGQNGSDPVSDTNRTEGRWNALQFTQDSIITTEGDVFTAYDFERGEIVYGRFTAFTLASGRVIAYRG